MPTDQNPIAQDPQEASQPPAPTPTPGAASSDSQDVQSAAEGSPNAEAARYRRRLRDAEAERDALGARVGAMQRREVERLAGDRLSQAGDLFTIGGADLADLLTEEGDVDSTAVTAAVGALLEARPGLALVPPPTWPDMGQGNRGSAVESASWRRLLGGR